LNRQGVKGKIGARTFKGSFSFGILIIRCTPGGEKGVDKQKKRNKGSIEESTEGDDP
jgi:putative component of membrane protein insertase Oxa1/YidC/SpoIIIJ protein YidD